MSILIFGAGYLGKRIYRELSEVEDTRLSPEDITDAAGVRRALAEARGAAVINAAGKTGRPNVDWCESHPIETYRSNAVGPMILAEECARAGAYLLHLGSGCIFSGASPRAGGFAEDDFAHPSSFYARAKYAADLILSRMSNVAIVRLRMPIDSVPDARNLITKLANYRQVIDVENSVTVVDDLVRVVRGLVERRAAGIFHATNPGVMRHRDLLALYKEFVDPNYVCEFIPEEDLVRRGLAVCARSNCVLSSARLAELGLEMRPIHVALRSTIEAYAREMRSAQGGVVPNLTK